MLKHYSSIHSNCLYDIWQISLAPSVPFLADICHVSICQIQQATPILLKSICYQLLSYQQQQGTQYIKERILQHEIISRTTFVINFTTLQNLKDNADTFRSIIFNDSSFHVILGITLAKVNIDLPALNKLTNYLCLFSVKILSNIIRECQFTNTQLEEWLYQQPLLMATLNDMPFIQATNYQCKVSLNYLTQQQRYILKHKPRITKKWQASLQQYLLANIKDNPASYHYLSFEDMHTQPLESFVKTHQFSVNNSQSFSQPIKKYLGLLQRYWIITTIILTSIMFGIFAWFFNVTEKQKNHKNLPKTNQAIYDVAIVRIDNEQQEPLSNKKEIDKPTKTDKKSDK